MKAMNMTNDFRELENFFLQRLLNIVHNLDVNAIVWQEVFENNVKLPKSTIIHVWKSGWESTIDEVGIYSLTNLLIRDYFK